MELTYGTICLESLYDFASRDEDAKSIEGRSSIGMEYGELATELTNKIEPTQGLYLWGKYENNGAWRNIYIGKSELGKVDNLHNRIEKELKIERVFLWWKRKFFKEEVFLEHCKSLYTSYSNNSKNHYKRAINKWGTTHVIWISTPEIDNSDIPKIEKELIEILNPFANDDRPPPVNNVTEKTTEIIKTFRDEIHRNREGAYKLKAIQNIKRI